MRVSHGPGTGEALQAVKHQISATVADYRPPPPGRNEAGDLPRQTGGAIAVRST